MKLPTTNKLKFHLVYPSLPFIVRACRELSLLTLVVSILFFISPTKAFASVTRTTTYIGNYEVTVEDSGTKKEVVRVAGTKGKVVKSRETNTKTKVASKVWEYTYYTTDIQGSTRQEITQIQINNPELVEGPNTYYAYGSVIGSEASLRGTPKQSVLNAQTQKIEDTYTGQKKDEETNLMYYNARYYNPQTGLFIQADSVDDGQNKYQYVASNPVNMTDPSGNCFLWIFGNDCEEDVDESVYLGDFDEYEKKSVEYAFTFYPKYLVEDIILEKVDDKQRELLAKVSDDEPEKIKVGWIFRNSGFDFKVSTILHEVFHTIQFRAMQDDKEYFSEYLNIIQDSGIRAEGQNEILGTDEFLELYRDTRLVIPSNLERLFGEYARKDILELGAELSLSYFGNGGEVSPDEFKNLWPEMYDYYEKILGKKK